MAHCGLDPKLALDSLYVLVTEVDVGVSPSHFSAFCCTLVLYVFKIAVT